MYLSHDEKQNIIRFLERNTTYDVPLLLKGKSDVQINAIYTRIKAAMTDYPKVIFDYLKSHPSVQPRYELEELRGMTYNELSELKKQLKIRKSRRKVVKQEEAPARTIEKATDYVKNESLRSFAAGIISHEMAESRERDLEILTEKEIFSMYGEELSAEQLAELGIVSDKIPYDVEQEIDERMEMIDYILNIGISIGGKKLEFPELLMMSDEEIKSLYSIILSTEKSWGDLKRLKK